MPLQVPTDGKIDTDPNAKSDEVFKICACYFVMSHLDLPGSDEALVSILVSKWNSDSQLACEKQYCSTRHNIVLLYRCYIEDINAIDLHTVLKTWKNQWINLDEDVYILHSVGIGSWSQLQSNLNHIKSHKEHLFYKVGAL